jgi:hypothetical protein
MDGTCSTHDANERLIKKFQSIREQITRKDNIKMHLGRYNWLRMPELGEFL